MELVKKSIKKNAVFNIIRQICAVFFPMITFSYASHVLGSANIGVYSFSQSIISYISTLSLLGISTYAVREGAFLRDNKKKIEQFANEVFSINVITTFISFSILWITIQTWRQIDSYQLIIWLLSIKVMLTTLGADWINNIYEDFQYIAIRYVLFQIIALIGLFVFVRSENDLIPYTIVTIIASSGGQLLNIFYIRKYVSLKFIFKMNFRKHILPLLSLFGSNIAVIIYVSSDISIITLLLNNNLAGIYAASTNIYQAVKHTVFAIVTVMIPRFSYYVTHNLNKKRDSLVNKTIKILSLVTLPAIVGLCLESYNILYIFSGKSYCTGSVSVCILSFAIPFAVTSNIFVSAVLIPLKKDKIVLSLSVMACILNVAINFIFIPVLGIEGAALTTLLAEMINGIGSYLFSKSYIHVKINKRDLAIEIIGSVFIIVSCLICNNVIKNIYLNFGCSIVLSVFVYFAFMHLAKNETYIELKNELKTYLSKLLRRIDI